MKKNSILDRLFHRDIQEEPQTIKQNVFAKLTINPPHLAWRSKEFLIGMATEDGETYDPNSSRSLWGRLPGADTLEDIDDLKTVIGPIAKANVAWKAVVRVSTETAQRYDLNRRESWKALVGDKINVIADELGIPQKDFCWVASWHGEGPSGPHVHMMYWDGSYTVHPQIMTSEKFKAMQERIRSSFEEGITNLKIPQLTSQEQAPEPELEDGEELEL